MYGGRFFVGDLSFGGEFWGWAAGELPYGTATLPTKFVTHHKPTGPLTKSLSDGLCKGSLSERIVIFSN